MKISVGKEDTTSDQQEFLNLQVVFVLHDREIQRTKNVNMQKLKTNFEPYKARLLL